MKLITDAFRHYEHGDTRIRKGFLFIPHVAKRPDGTNDWRWLEFAEWEEEHCVMVGKGSWWSTKRFLTKGNDPVGTVKVCFTDADGKEGCVKHDNIKNAKRAVSDYLAAGICAWVE